MQPLVVTVEEAAKALTLSECTTRKLIKDGTIPSIRISPRRVVIPVKALEKILEGEVSIA